MTDKIVTEAMTCGDCGWQGPEAVWRAKCFGFPCKLKAQSAALDDDAEWLQSTADLLEKSGLPGIHPERFAQMRRIADRLQAKAPETCRKVACGLRQIAESMAQNTLTKYRAVQEWQDRVNGFAAELEAEPNHRERDDVE